MPYRRRRPTATNSARPKKSKGLTEPTSRDVEANTSSGGPPDIRECGGDDPKQVPVDHQEGREKGDAVRSDLQEIHPVLLRTLDASTPTRQGEGEGEESSGGESSHSSTNSHSNKGDEDQTTAASKGRTMEGGERRPGEKAPREEIKEVYRRGDPLELAAERWSKRSDLGLSPGLCYMLLWMRQKEHEMGLL